MNQPNEEFQDVYDQLSALAPGSEDAPRSAAQMLASVKRAAAPRPNPIQNLIRSFNMTLSRRATAVSLLVVLLAVVLLSFPAVRAAASDFLGLFRVQKFATISVSPEQIAVLERMAEEGLTPGEFEIHAEPVEIGPAPNLSLAADAAGMPAVRTIGALGEPQEIRVMDGGSGTLTINLEGARAIVEAAGVDPLLLPDSLEGAEVNVTVYPSVQQMWADEVVMAQMPSPLVEYPGNVDTTVLGEALLRVLGTPADEARSIAQSIDWTSTLLLPIPQEAATYREVTVDGVSGVAFDSIDSSASGLLWQKDGIVYMLVGQDGIETLLGLAQSLR